MLASSFSTRFLLRKNRRSRSLPPLGATCSLPHFRFAQMWPRIFPRGLPGYVPLFPGWPRARTPALLVFNSVFAAQKPAQPVTGPTFWVCRAKAGAAFRCAKPPCAVVRFAAMASPPRTAILPSPSRLRRAGPPTAKPRRLLPFGRISLRETALAGHRPHRGRCFGLPRFRFAQARSPGQNPGACSHSVAFRLRRNRAAGRCPRRGQRARYPIFAPLKCGPAYSRGVCRGTFLCSPAGPALAPRRLLPFGRISLRETARPVVAPAGGNVLAPPFSLRSNVAPRSHPGACSRSVAFRSAKPRGRSSAPPGPMFCRPRHGSAAPGPQRQNPGPPRFQSGFFCAKTGGRVPPLSDGGALTKSENIILCASSCHPPRSPYPHCTLPRVRFSGIGQKKKPQRKPAAAVAYHSLFLSFRLCGTRSPACFVIRIHSTSLSSRGENKKGKRARFPFLLCSKRLISARSAFSLFFAAPVPDAARLIRTHTLLFGTTLPPPPAPSRSAFQ